MDETILAVIPARSGSTGVKNKNIRDVAGQPLLSYTIDHAKNSDYLSDFLVSTDSEEVASIAEDAGAPVPFLRPNEYATDDAPMIDVLKHALETYEDMNDSKVDCIVTLQPTAPFRLPSDIDEAIEIFLESESNSLLSCFEGLHAHPYKMYEMSENGTLDRLSDGSEDAKRRQDLSTVYVLNGAIFISSRSMILEQEKVYNHKPLGYEMPIDRSLNIDIPYELKIAQLLMEDGIELPVSDDSIN